MDQLQAAIDALQEKNPVVPPQTDWTQVIARQSTPGELLESVFKYAVISHDGVQHGRSTKYDRVWFHTGSGHGETPYKFSVDYDEVAQTVTLSGAGEPITAKLGKLSNFALASVFAIAIVRVSQWPNPKTDR